MAATTHPSTELKHIIPALLGGEGQGRGTRALAYLSWCSHLLPSLWFHTFPPHHAACSLLPPSRVWGSRRTDSTGLVWVVDDEPSSDMVAALPTPAKKKKNAESQILLIKEQSVPCLQ